MTRTRERLKELVVELTDANSTLKKERKQAEQELRTIAKRRNELSDWLQEIADELEFTGHFSHLPGVVHERKWRDNV